MPTLLDGLDDGEEAHTLIFTEDKMRTCANDRAAAKDAAAQKRRPPRKPPSGNLGAAWRVHGGSEIALAAAAPAAGEPVLHGTGIPSPRLDS